MVATSLLARPFWLGRPVGDCAGDQGVDSVAASCKGGLPPVAFKHCSLLAGASSVGVGSTIMIVITVIVITVTSE
jgi:hypothetical protein